MPPTHVGDTGGTGDRCTTRKVRQPLPRATRGHPRRRPALAARLHGAARARGPADAARTACSPGPPPLPDQVDESLPILRRLRPMAPRHRGSPFRHNDGVPTKPGQLQRILAISAHWYLASSRVRWLPHRRSCTTSAVSRALCSRSSVRPQDLVISLDAWPSFSSRQVGNWTTAHVREHLHLAARLRPLRGEGIRARMRKRRRPPHFGIRVGLDGTHRIAVAEKGGGHGRRRGRSADHSETRSWSVGRDATPLDRPGGPARRGRVTRSSRPRRRPRQPRRLR